MKEQMPDHQSYAQETEFLGAETFELVMQATVTMMFHKDSIAPTAVLS